MNILLFDNTLSIIGPILDNTSWNISVLITGRKVKELESNERIGSIYTQLEVWNNDDLSLFDYNDLDYLWKAQLKIENSTKRELNDFQIAKWTYYQGYAFVKQLFEKNNIDMVIVKGPNHGFIFDRMLTSYATVKNILNFNITTQLYLKRVVLDNLNQTLIKTENFASVNIENALQPLKKIEINYERSVVNPWEMLYKLGYNIGGKLGEEIIKCVRYKNLGNDKLGVTIIEKIQHYRELLKIKRYYNRFATEIDYNLKYVLYALHLEPEGVVAGYADMDSQLVAIRMLSQCLPKGWILYVKEHPMQFDPNNDLFYPVNLYGTSVYKSKRFYEKILSMNNVKLVKICSDTQKAIEKSMAVSTLSGTIASETIALNKPIVLFSTKNVFYKYVEDVFAISSFKDCKDALIKIEKGFIPQYNNFKEVLNSYLIDMTDEYCGYLKAIKAIEMHIRKRDEKET